MIEYLGKEYTTILVILGIAVLLYVVRSFFEDLD